MLKTFEAISLKVKTKNGTILDLEIEKKQLSSIFDDFNINSTAR